MGTPKPHKSHLNSVRCGVTDAHTHTLGCYGLQNTIATFPLVYFQKLYTPYSWHLTSEIFILAQDIPFHA